MERQLRHTGEIVSIDGSVLKVRMTVGSGCSECSVRGACGMSESEDRIVSVYDPLLASTCAVGEQVYVSVTQVAGMKAVVYSYIMPFFVMVAVMVTLSALGAGELLTGGATLLSCALYYIVLHFMRDRISKEIEFSIERITE